MKKITVLFPTKVESQYFNHENVCVEISGIGLAAAAYNTLRVIRDSRPDIIIMAGIAGVYPHSDLKIGDTVLVEKEYEADLGLFYEDGFKHISDMRIGLDLYTNRFFNCPYIEEDMPLGRAVSNSMNAGISPYICSDGIDIENMEGSAFFFVCEKEGVEFYEIRSVSNVAETSHKDWDYNTSLKNLTNGLNLFIDHLLKK